ncbi:hypothetical protein BH20GEM2_BH20GEM2_02260 [soil metagenome]
MGVTVLFGLPPAARAALAHAVRATALRPVLALQRGALEEAEGASDVTLLRSERDSLAAYLVSQANLGAENQELRALLGLRRRLPSSFVPAEAMRIPGPEFDGAFMITAGRKDGLTVGSPIVAADGLVGIVRNVDASSSIGIDWTNSDFRASAMTPDGEIYGLVEPTRSRGRGDMLILTGTPYHAELEPGTPIVTAGSGGVYPRGIPIGTVVGTQNEGGNWSRSYLIRPRVTPAQMTHVLVVGQATDTGQIPDLAAIWGIRPGPAEDRVAAAVLPAGALLETPTETSAPTASEPPPSTQPAAPAPRPAPRPARQEGPRLLGVPVDRPPADTARE